MIDQILALSKQVDRPIAAFDADGTLWNVDLGESLFDYQIRHKLIPLPDDPWDHYERLKAEVSHEAAYLWLAQINSGRPIAQVKQWAAEAVREMQPLPIFAEIQSLISQLQKSGVEVYIVTASIKWAVEPGAALLNIPAERVIGIETKIDSELVTDQQWGPITYKKGKVEGLLKATGGHTPYFCAGNTEGDLPLLESALSCRLVVAAARQGEKNFPTERKMVELAKRRNWFVLDYL